MVGGLAVMMALVSVACDSPSEEALPAAATSRQNDFEEFYQRFLNDEDFQLNHINFPLEGLPANATSEDIDNGFRWEKRNWRMHRPMAEDTGFDSDFNFLSDNLVVEEIIHEHDGYGMLRRFARLGDEWYLIYYAALNPLQ